MGVVIHPELYFEILRPMVKKLAQSDLPFLRYGQKIANLKDQIYLDKSFFFTCINKTKVAQNSILHKKSDTRKFNNLLQKV